VESSLRLEAVTRTALDAGLARLGGGRLTRVEGVTYLETDRPIEDATYHLALAGIRVAPCARIPVAATGLHPAIALDLAPLERATPGIDVVEVRRVPLGDASAALMRRRLSWLRSSHEARDACRRLLHDEDAVLAWRRVVWCTIGSLHEARSRARLRPVVFDRSALDRHPARWAYVTDGAIERWAFT
jgi:hypothetical protein